MEKKKYIKKIFLNFHLTNEFINQNILDNTLVEVDIDNYLKLIKSKGNIQYLQEEKLVVGVKV